MSPEVMSTFQTETLSSRDARIRALTEWARDNGIRFGDVAGVTKLQTLAETWFPTICDATIASYVKAVLRILQRESTS